MSFLRPGADGLVPWTTDQTARTVQRRSWMRTSGVLVLSQHVDTHHVAELVASGGGMGYLLKDHVGDIAEFGDAVSRIAAGGSVIDRDVVAELITALA